MTLKFIILEPAEENHREFAIPLNREIGVGRSTDCDVVIRNATVSRQHLRIWSDGCICRITDDWSRGGTRVNKSRIGWPTILRDGDEIQAGRVKMQFRIRDNNEPLVADPGWLQSNNGAVVGLAKSFRKTGDSTILSVLGDALEEAGCRRADILEHCREEREHHRECWVVGMILGQYLGEAVSHRG